MAGATRGWWRDRVAFGDYMLFCFAMRVVLAPSALHTACGCLWENNAPAALHGVAGDTGSPAATTCFFCFAIRVVWRLRRYILLVAAYGKTMRLRRYTRLSGDRVACGDYMLFLFCHSGGFGAFGATYCLWLVMGNNAPAALHAVVGRQGRLRRLHAFLFCHAGVLAPSARHIVG